MSLPSLDPKQTAAVIRALLRETFPKVKFSVITNRGSMVSSVRISWVDGPTARYVDALVEKFRAGSFNGMTDSYDYDRGAVIELPGGTYRPGTRYVTTARKTTITLAKRGAAQIAKFYGYDEPTIIPSEWGGWHVVDEPAKDPFGNGRLWSEMINSVLGDRTLFAARA